MYYQGFSYRDAYSLPVWQRVWFIERINKELVKEVIKTIASFTNRNGGIIFIGVDDNGSILGIKKDYETLKKDKQSRDGFHLNLNNSLKGEFENTFLINNIKISFEYIQNEEVCRIDVKRTKNKRVYVGEDQDFYIRYGPENKKLNPKEASEYKKH